MAKERKADCPFVPARGRIVCERTRLLPKTKGDIEIPDNKLSLYMRVVAVGPGKLDGNGKEIKPLVKVDDIVTAGRVDLQPFGFPDFEKIGTIKEYYIFDEISVLATVFADRLIDGTPSKDPKIVVAGTH